MLEIFNNILEKNIFYEMCFGGSSYFFFTKKMSVIYHTCKPHIPLLTLDPNRCFYCPYPGRGYINEWLAAKKNNRWGTSYME